MGMENSPLAEALRQAAMAEREGHSFYMMAAATTRDPKGKTVFEQLAREEMDHLNFLRTHYDAVLQTGRLSPAAKLQSPIQFEPTSPIFSDSFKSRISEAHYEMTALSVGIQLESDAIDFYQRQAAAADSNDVQVLFEQLAKWEQGHYRALLTQQEELKSSYWSDAGFSPF